MKQTRDKWNSILWNENLGFAFLIGLSWLSEALRIPHYLFGEAFAPNWHRAILRTIVIVVIWAWVHLVTKRLLKRLHHLEEFIRMCGWCRKVCSHGEWLPLEKYLDSQYAMRTTHGMCPDCLKQKVVEIKQANPTAQEP
jgi:hypothetical protein